MSRILAFVLIVCAVTTLALPIDDGRTNEDALLVRSMRSAYHGYGHHGYRGGYNGGFGGYGGPGNFGGGSSFAQSSANSGSISTPFGSASFSNANSNSGAYGR